jgi:hypothetical protein
MKVLVVLSLIAAAPMGQGAIVLWANQEIAIPTTLEGVYLNIGTGETHFSDVTGFSNAQVNFFFGGFGIATNEDALPARVGVGSLDPIRRLNPGDPVNDTLSFGPQANGGSSGHLSTVPAPEQFESGVPGYLGFQFDLNEDGQYVFGWMRVTLTNGTSDGVIHEWAYSDTPGEEIVVGAVPEPSTWLLGLLGGTLAMGFRRTRNGRIA